MTLARINSPRAMLQSTHDTMIQEFWLDGMRPGQIAEKMGMNIGSVTGAITRFRNESWEQNQASLSEKTAETLIRMRRLQIELWNMYDQDGVATKSSISIMAEIRKNEEFIARISGLVTTKTQVDITHQIKMYDFEDDYPDQEPVIESTSRELPRSASSTANIDNVNSADSADNGGSADGVLVTNGTNSTSTKGAGGDNMSTTTDGQDGKSADKGAEYPKGDIRREPDYNPSQSIVPLPDGTVVKRTTHSPPLARASTQ